ncbi:MAG: hypothetical protein DLM73_17525 [Chthoniobacterales bacterium]|nr:MAG: hypothetical protein DLM73_17525 [Chthoniobacterales bacterium]
MRKSVFLVLPNELFQESEVPAGWGVLTETERSLHLMRKPVWHDNAAETRLRLLQRIARAGTRQFNRQLGITLEEIQTARQML